MESARILGTTDDVTTCECCGRRDLKGTVAIAFGEDAEPEFYGVVCAANALKTTAKAVRRETKRADDAKKAREAATRREAQEAAAAPWFAFLEANGTGGDVFTRIESLGGYAKARAAFKASREVAA